MQSKLKCPKCNSNIYYYWGDVDCDTYRAYLVDESGHKTDETTISPRMDRVDEVENEEFWMCSNQECGKSWDKLAELKKELNLK